VDAVVGVVIAVALLATLMGTLLMFPAMWEGFRDQWRRTPPDRRRRGVVGGALAAAGLVVASALVIAEPWGRETILYVIGVGGGAVMLLCWAGVAVQAVQESRRAKRRRSSPD
jgi:hypothetical protein